MAVDISLIREIQEFIRAHFGGFYFKSSHQQTNLVIDTINKYRTILQIKFKEAVPKLSWGKNNFICLITVKLHNIMIQYLCILLSENILTKLSGVYYIIISIYLRLLEGDREYDEFSLPLLLRPNVLSTFLTANTIESVAQLLQSQQIDLFSISLCSDEDLQAINVPLGPRKKISQALERRKRILLNPGPLSDSAV